MVRRYEKEIEQDRSFIITLMEANYLRSCIMELTIPKYHKNSTLAHKILEFHKIFNIILKIPKFHQNSTPPFKTSKTLRRATAMAPNWGPIMEIAYLQEFMTEIKFLQRRVGEGRMPVYKLDLQD